MLTEIEFAEQLGFDSAWLRHRHMQPGISSPVAIMAAASQRTSRIELGTAVTPLGAENPFRLAEDLATVDVLSGGRINPGFSVGTPMNFEYFRDSIYPGTADLENLSYDRLGRFLDLIRGGPVWDFEGKRDVVEVFTKSVQPQSPGLADRVWYGGGSGPSMEWAGSHGLNLLTSSVVKSEDGSADFAAIQRSQIDLFRSFHPLGEAARVSQGLVVIPTDTATAAQKAKYEAYVEARTPRTTAPQGPAKLLFAPDLIGSSEEIAEQLQAHAGYQAVDEVAFALPFSFEHEDYVQILTDMATRLGPALGWSPSS